MSTKGILILYLLIINLIGLASMAIDKIRAMERRFRIPASVLLIIAVIGGSVGSIIGMFLFRHKIRKPKFRIGLPLILVLQILLWVILFTTAKSIIFI